MYWYEWQFLENHISEGFCVGSWIMNLFYFLIFTDLYILCI